MKLRFLSVVILLMTTLGVCAEEIKPVYSNTLNGGAFFIGNTNTDFKNKSDITEELEADGEIVPIQNFPDGMKAKNDSSNSNYVKFLIPDLEKKCDTTSIVYARLSWSGGSFYKTKGNKKDTVICYLTNSDSVIIREFKVAAQVSRVIGENYFYSCHSVITDEIKSLIKPNTEYRFYVSDLSYVHTGKIDKDHSKNCTGWTLSLVYQHNLLPKRTILFYDCDIFGKTGSATGEYGEALDCEFSFGENIPKLEKDLITFGLSSLGSVTKAQDDNLETFRNQSNRKAIITPYVNERDADRYLGSYKTEKDDYIRNSIYYKYENENYILSKYERYTRSFGLCVGSYDRDDFDVKKDDKSLELLVGGTNEHHFLTSAFLMFGAPDVPEVAMPMEIEGGKTTLNPDESYKIKFYVSVGDNKEGVRIDDVVVPFSEYIGRIDEFSITPIAAIKDSFKGNDNNVVVSAGGAEEKLGLPNYRDNNKVNIQDFESRVMEMVNKYLLQVDIDNEKAVFVEGNPTNIEKGEIKISFDKLVLPSAPTVKNQNVIEIMMVLHTKPAGSWVYEKASFVGRPVKITPQAELTVTTGSSGETSVFEGSNMSSISDFNQFFADEKCKNGTCHGLYCGGGSDGPIEGVLPPGGCLGLGGNSVTSGGIFRASDDAKRIEVTVQADASCRKIADSLDVTFCDDGGAQEMTIDRLNKMLVDYRVINIDSIARADSLIWEMAKRDSLVNFAERYGVNRSRLEQLLGKEKGDLASVTASNDFLGLFSCEGAGAALETDSIEMIVNMKHEVSRLLAFYCEEDTLKHCIVEKSINVLSEEAKTTKFVLEEKTVYLYYDSPWDKMGKECDKFIRINFINLAAKEPAATFDGKEIHNGDTVQVCLGRQISSVNVQKSHKGSLIYAHITQSDPDTEVWGKKRINEKEHLFDNPFEWNLLNAGVTSDEPGVYNISLTQYDMSSNCESDPLLFYLEIINVRIDDKPSLSSESSQNTFCQSLEADSVKIWVTRTEEQMEYGVRWEQHIIEDVNGKLDTIVQAFGEKDTIYARIDSLRNVEYQAVFFVDQCESDASVLRIQINPKADSIMTDTMRICNGYHLTPADVKNHLAALALAEGRKLETSRLQFFRYHKDFSSVAENIKRAVEGDTVALVDLLKEAAADKSCESGNTPFYQFVVRSVTKDGCYGPGSIISVETFCHDQTAPEFVGGVDSILYCVGDSPESNMFVFLGEEKYDKQKYHWYWYNSPGSMPTYSYTPQKDYIQESYRPGFGCEEPNAFEYFVVRIDSNRCVSQPSKFRVVVDKNINTFPRVGDLTKIIPVSDSLLTLSYCKGVNPYDDDRIPTLGYPSEDYQIEWYKKDRLDDDCDANVKGGVVKKEQVFVDFQYPGVAYYCVRQSTSLGCKGPWLNVQAIVNDSVREVPPLKLIERCQGADSVLVEMPELSSEHLRPTYYDAQMNVIPGSRAYLTTDVPGVFTSAMKRNKFYVSLTDKETGCRGEVIGIDAIVHPKPNLPVVAGDTSLYLCAVGDTVDLAARVDPKINPLDKNTSVVWSPSSVIVTSQNANAHYTIHQMDTLSKCEGEKIEISVKVENTFKYKPFGVRDLCFGESIALRDTVERLLVSNHQIIEKERLGFKVFALHNRLKGAEVDGLIQSSKERYANDTASFLVEILDTVSGCAQRDTAIVIFHGLPNAKVEKMLTVCQMTELLLPTPSDARYSYSWRDASDAVVNGSPAKVVLDADERFWLTERDLLFGCEEQFSVDVTVFPTPRHALTADTTFCQNGAELRLASEVNPTDDGYNVQGNLLLQWFDEKMDSIANPIKTDALVVEDLIQDFRFTLRQSNTKTRCFKDTTITLSLRKNIHLAMADLEAVCEPETVNFAQRVDEYLFANIAETNLVNTNGLRLDYAKIVNGRAETLSAEAAGALSYTKGADVVEYIYKVTDAENICAASDTVSVTIHKKPLRPLIENGADTVLFCGDRADIRIGAEDLNPILGETEIYWGEYSSAEKGDSLAISAKEKLYTAFAKNKFTACVSDLDTVVAVIASPIRASVIGEAGVIERCAGEHLNVAALAKASFSVAERWDSEILYSAKANGNIVSLSALEDVSRATQDTIDYEFGVVDKRTGCEGVNSLRLIFHSKPKFEVEGETLICQGADLSLRAVGEKRAASYSWKFEGEELTESSSDQLIKRGLMNDATLLVIAQLDGTTCVDTLTQRIMVNETPAQLADQQFAFCQTSVDPKRAILLNRSAQEQSRFSLQWADAEKQEISVDDQLTLSIADDTVYKLFVRQQNEERGLVCPSEWSSVTVAVNKHIEVTLRDTNICMPEHFNLAKYAKEEKRESADGFRLAIERISKLDGLSENALSDSTKISETGRYRIRYSDKNSCETSAEVTVNFISKPLPPTFAVPAPIYLCQGIDTVVVPNFVAGDYEYLWSKEGGNETFVSDTLRIDAARSNASAVTYKVWRRDTIYGCESEKAEVAYQILDSIRTKRIETIHLCESESVDLDSVANELFSSMNELKNSVYSSDEKRQRGTQLLYSNAVKEGGFYWLEANDVVSGCRAKSIVEVATHMPPTLLYKGETTLCSGSDVNLVAYPKEGEAVPAYQWTDAQGKVVSDSTLRYVAKVDEGSVASKQEVFELKGTFHITNQKACSRSRLVEITTHPIPPTLPNDTVDICQNTGSAIIPVDFQDNVFNLKRYDSDGNELDEIVVGTDKVVNVRFSVAQEDRVTKCLGVPATIFVNVRQSIELHINEPSAVCAPSTINLTEIVTQASLESNRDIAEKKRYEIKHILLKGREAERTDAIDQSGLYQVFIADQYGCAADEEVQLTIHQQPAPLGSDTSFCQNTGVHTLAGVGATDGLLLEWLDLSTAYPDSLYSDTMRISTSDSGVKHLLVRQTTIGSRCSSEPTAVTLTIHPAIRTDLRDTTLCYGGEFDFIEYAERQLPNGSSAYLESAQREVPLLPIDYHAIKQAGSFIAHYKDGNQCVISDTMSLSFAPKIELVLDYPTSVCAGDTIKVKASGAEHFVWNESSDDIDSIFIVTTSHGVENIRLTASSAIRSVAGAGCGIDTTIQVKVNKVPDLLADYGDTLYCQLAQTAALSLEAVETGAMVLWADPNDNYTTVSRNGTLKPSSLYAGDFVYKFRQQLGECQTAWQDYKVSIQPSITEKALVADTAYCKDEVTEPLLAKWSNPLYEVVWSDEKGDALSADFRPSSAVAGEQFYSVRLAYKACQSEPSTMRVSVQEAYGKVPDIDDHFIFCEKTGVHVVKVNAAENGVRLNWYAENGGERLDSIVINTDEALWREAKFFVTQSVVNGCESPLALFDVAIQPSVQPVSLALDTCADVVVTLDELAKMYNITDKIDTLWTGLDKSQRMDLKSNIGYTGDYQFSVVNPFGCKATHTAHINMLQVEGLEYTAIKSVYCYDDTVSLVASATNADIEWENVTEGLTHYGNAYNFSLSGDANVTMTATVINKPVCQQRVDFQFKTYEKTEAIVNGETNVCLGNSVLLNAGNLYQAVWSVGDSSVVGSDFSFTPKKSEILTLSGLDKNQCPVKKHLTINTVKQPDPIILVTPMIRSSRYHLNRDTFEVRLEATLSSALDENYSYKWNFGDGDVVYGSNVESHEYDAALVRLTKPIDVTLTVEHAYGCSGETKATLLVDPDFDIPNTMTPEDEFMADYELQIFDRIGNLIYEGRGWRGEKNDGSEAFADTYFFAISYYVEGEKKIKTGYITLVR